jgi:hypothetical protein
MSQMKKTAAQVAFESVPNARTFLPRFTSVRCRRYRALNDVAAGSIAHGSLKAAYVRRWCLYHHHWRAGAMTEKGADILP